MSIQLESNRSSVDNVSSPFSSALVKVEVEVSSVSVGHSSFKSPTSRDRSDDALGKISVKHDERSGRLELSRSQLNDSVFGNRGLGGFVSLQNSCWLWKVLG